MGVAECVAVCVMPVVPVGTVVPVILVVTVVTNGLSGVI